MNNMNSMNIISSFEFINDFTNIVKYKFLLFNDLMKKINKKYLHESKILFLYSNKTYDSNNINKLVNSLKRYDKNLQLFLINTDEYYLNKLSLFYLNEFLTSTLTMNNIKAFFLTKKECDFIPQIIINNKINKNIIITGVCRDIIKFIYNSLHKFIYLTHYFQKCKIIIYENDSSDNTLEVLHDFKNKFKNIDIIILSEENIIGTLTQRVSHARNKILNYIHHNKLTPDYVINIDMDDILINFKCDSILYPFNENIEWSMFGGNSDIYYDMWALRSFKNPNKDFWENKKLPLEERLKYYFRISGESTPIPVISCFNGIGIYKYKHIIDCLYDGNKTCEHIHFHQNMIKIHNATLFIHPKLIVGPHKILSKPMFHYKINRLIKNTLVD